MQKCKTIILVDGFANEFLSFFASDVRRVANIRAVMSFSTMLLNNLVF